MGADGVQALRPAQGKQEWLCYWRRERVTIEVTGQPFENEVSASRKNGLAIREAGGGVGQEVRFAKEIVPAERHKFLGKGKEIA